MPEEGCVVSVIAILLIYSGTSKGISQLESELCHRIRMLV